MPSNRRVPALALVGLGLICASPASLAQDAEAQAEKAPPAHIRLVYSVTLDRAEEGESVERRTPLVPHTESTTTVLLGPRVVQVEVATDAAPAPSRSLADFEAGTEYRIDDGAGTYRASSLLVRLGFTETEMWNRIQMAKMLAAAGLEDPSSAPMELSILFGWRASKDRARIAFREEEGEQVFHVEGEVLTRWRPSEHVLDAAQALALARFLHRRGGLHPEIRDRIVAGRRAPATLWRRWRTMGEKDTEVLTLVAAERLADPPRGIDGLRREFRDDPQGRLAARVLGGADDLPRRLTREEFVEMARAAHGKGNAEDAALLLLECSLQEGADVTAELRKLMEDPEASGRVRVVMRAVGGGNRNPEAALERLDAVDRSLLTHPALLDVFRANVLVNLQRAEEAEKAFLTALGELPFVTGAYKDMGDFLYRTFRTEAAWQAWEVGRHVNPDHPMWEGIEGLEEHLREKFAELL